MYNLILCRRTIVSVIDELKKDLGRLLSCRCKKENIDIWDFFAPNIDAKDSEKLFIVMKHMGDL